VPARSGGRRGPACRTACQPDALDDPAVVQLWGPRYSLFAVAAHDVAVFTLGRLPDDERGRRRAEEAAARLQALVGSSGVPSPYGHAGRVLEVMPNSLRYAAPTGTVLLRWDGARQPTVWTVPPPPAEPRAARLELARRHLHIYGPTTPAAFAGWAGVAPGHARATWDALTAELVPVRTPIGDAWALASDEADLTADAQPPAAARLLPSGDAYYLLQGADRELLVPDAVRRAELWTSRVWPGALIVGGEVVGTWRRAGGRVSAAAWRPLSAPERAAVEVEGRIAVDWATAD
jgi:hypothetical protein